jgi:hypothetical protein
VTARTSFPILREYAEPGRKDIPWEMIAPHEGQARLNHGQSLERLAERGGLAACEAVAVLENRAWRRMTEADQRLTQLETEWRARQHQVEMQRGQSS